MEPRLSNTVRDWLVSLRTPVAFYPAILLGAQIVLAIGLTWAARGTLDPSVGEGRLLTFDPKAIASVRIEGAGETLTLSRGKQGWAIADLKDFPVEGTKVEALLDKLAGLKRPLPVATSAAAQRRHKVADDGFERKLTLEAGGKPVATLLLGDSPGFKREFARPAGDAAVYDLDLPLFEVSNRRDDWLQRDTLKLDEEKIDSIATADWTLTKDKDGWHLAGTTDKPTAAAVTGLLARVGNLGYRGVLGIEDKPEYNLATPALDLTVQLADGSRHVYRIAQAKDSKDYVLKAGDRPWYFKLSEFDLEGLLGLNRDKLLGIAPKVAPPAAAPQGAATGGPAPGAPAGDQAPPALGTPDANAPAAEPVPLEAGIEDADAPAGDEPTPDAATEGDEAPPEAESEGDVAPAEDQDAPADTQDGDMAAPAAKDQTPPAPAAN
ncbi:DUF4340 domain-containing protein [uncultured Thiodictyon sp.]|uniref:DUF4340 domain-containing protein n=1 Tax=uncultured Thiodictyon sp. TaxID=1846217 RepID=UPI0025E3B4C9|nr:DUF4340 domain-containing protein [uncultured Thiodictyon sp.]